ncbi:I78 family peptidase inhibitor [Qipengyuania sp. ASV99]|uniref:I78 family peptidase inhibitor n=1 Tax=Qipengyuania sp. ASV99 TaxID=3399681 RepID=UPI003A4C5ADC
MIRQIALCVPATLALIGCTGSSAPPAAQAPLEPARPAPGNCDAAAAQSYIGQQASTASGAAILAASKARTLRWGPPNSAWTMDYREDRVNIRYDDAMIITQVTCG